ncbi:MAG: ACT domain-containing protein [Oscillospiraceae bacterium]|nr:ACT domain-containing protein [Oscillospiraceae bacterium]
MELKTIPYSLTVCKVTSAADIDLHAPFYFIGKTDQELSLVCRTEDTPAQTAAREDGWRGFRIEGVLDFSLIGILSKLTAILAAEQIGIFAVSTYNTDYILVKEAQFTAALDALRAAGYTITEAAA